MKPNLSFSSFLSLTLIWLSLQSADAITYNDTLGMGQFLGTSDTLVSANGNFELGFFNLSTKYYVGIWFKKVPKNKIVWVANRKQAASNSNAVLTFADDGNLVIQSDGMVYFVTKFSDIISTHVMLFDSGNLLLINNSNLNTLWQSFDHPTNTLLPGMKLGFERVSGMSWSLTSWTGVEDPSPGNFSLEADVSAAGGLELIIKKESVIYWIGDELSNFTFQSSDNRDPAIWDGNSYVTWQGQGQGQGNYTSLVVLEVSGELNQQFWSQDTMQWVSLLSSKCGRYTSCGNFGICNPQATNPSECLQGFKENKSTGCVRKTELCSSMSSDGFLPLDTVDFSSDTPLAFM